MISETELGSNIPKLLASFKIKMARSRASLIFVPGKARERAVLYILWLPTETTTSGAQAHLSGDDSRVVLSVSKSFDCFPNITQAGPDPPVEWNIHFVLRVNSSLRDEVTLSKHHFVSHQLEVAYSALLIYLDTVLQTIVCYSTCFFPFLKLKLSWHTVLC